MRSVETVELRGYVPLDNLNMWDYNTYPSSTFLLIALDSQRHTQRINCIACNQQVVNKRPDLMQRNVQMLADLHRLWLIKIIIGNSINVIALTTHL